MNKRQFLTEVDKILDNKQYTLVTYNFLYNALHNQYYMHYQAGEYDKCLRYIEKHKDKLTLEHTPPSYYNLAKSTLEAIDKMIEL